MCALRGLISARGRCSNGQGRDNARAEGECISRSRPLLHCPSAWVALIAISRRGLLIKWNYAMLCTCISFTHTDLIDWCYLYSELWRPINTRLALLGSALMPYGCCQCTCQVKSEVIVQLQLQESDLPPNCNPNHCVAIVPKLRFGALATPSKPYMYLKSEWLHCVTSL